MQAIQLTVEHRHGVNGKPYLLIDGLPRLGAELDPDQAIQLGRQLIQAGIVAQQGERGTRHYPAESGTMSNQLTDAGRNPLYEGLFEGETQGQRNARLAAARNGGTPAFEREDRYIVIKRKDLNVVPFAALQSFLEHLRALDSFLPRRECVVVESDWPEYETVWAMIEARVNGKHPEQAEGAHVPDEAFETEFADWWERDGKYCRAGGGDYERTFAFQAWRHLYPQLLAARATSAKSSRVQSEQAEGAKGEQEAFEAWWARSGFTKFKDTAQAAWEARAALVHPSPAPELESATGYAEARQCASCRHIGINDSSGTAACHDCDWRGPEPAEDKCPGCGSVNCMAAACPECGGRYELAAEAKVAVPVAQAGQVPEGWLVMRCTSSVPREGDQWEIYDPQGSGGVVSVHDVKDWAVRGLLDALAAVPQTEKEE